MATVIGMAKAPLDLRGAKARNLRLDAELLARRVSELGKSGCESVGYLLVLTDKVARRVRGWDVVSGNFDFNVLVAELAGRDLEALREEKRRNARGMRSGKPSDSVASLGRRLAEEALDREIRERHPGVRRSTVFSTPRPGIDLYSLLTAIHPGSATGNSVFAEYREKLVIVAELVANG